MFSHFVIFFNPVASLCTLALCFQSGCLFCIPWKLAKFSLSRSFLYPHSLFFPTTLKKPNGETSVFSKQNKKNNNDDDDNDDDDDNNNNNNNKVILPCKFRLEYCHGNYLKIMGFRAINVSPKNDT